MSDVTRLLQAIERGESEATEKLLPLVYDELRRLARAHMSQERSDHTLQPTALVHEAYLRLVGNNNDARWDNRGHFFAAAAEAMRRILVENARRKARVRHGGDLEKVELDDFPIVTNVSDADLLDVHDALDRLAEADSQAAELVKLHYFLGLPMDEAAQLLEISSRTAYRNWSFARAWLYQHLGRESS
jgi:RNA polymerase sigma factor (TIGR02999 family)